MKREEWTRKYYATRDALRELEGGMRRDWDVGSTHCGVRFRERVMDDPRETPFDFWINGNPATMTADELVKLSVYRTAYEQWLANELDELPASNDSYGKAICR